MIGTCLAIPLEGVVRARLVATAFVVLAFACPAARAQPTTASWVAGVSGSWDDPSKWTTNPFYPNNGNPSGSAYAVVVDAAAATGYTISLNRDVTVNSLTVNNTNATVLVSPSARLRASGLGE